MPRGPASPLFLVFLGLAMAEMGLLAMWSKRYFMLGLPIFVRRITIKRSERRLLANLPLQYLQDTTRRTFWADLAYRPLSRTTWAFREAFHFERRAGYYPVMRGVIEIDRRHGEIRVIGRAAWHAVLITCVCLAATVKLGHAGPIALFLFLIGGSYWIQRWRFGHAVEALQVLVDQALADGNTAVVHPVPEAMRLR